MRELPERAQQIRLVHADFIRQVVETCCSVEKHQVFEQLVAAAEQQGWNALGSALRRIHAGDRSPGVLDELDDEDRVIAESVLMGLQDPNTLPDPSKAQDPTLAAPGLAQMIHAARSNPQALAIIGEMAEQMSRVGGGMSRLAGVIRPLINGERDPDRLCKGMDTRTEQLVLDLLAELGKLDAH